LIKEKVLVVGLGEIGRPMFEILRESGMFSVYGIDINEKKMHDLKQDKSMFPSEFDVLHVCILCTDLDEFVNIIFGYIQRFKPKLVIINSTVQPGTIMKVQACCDCHVVHSPIRGVHSSKEHMKWEIKRWTKYVGGASPEAAMLAQDHFKKMGLKTKVLKSCAETELAKLFETTYRAWMIVCFQEMHRISRHLEASLDDIVDFIEDTHRVRLDRPVMFPDVIGGHCQIPNTRLLLKSYNSELLQLILRSNERRKEEKKDMAIAEEIEKIKKRVVTFEKLAQSVESEKC
jgi:UDP-N-acetyl-D-mannosaminuronate dehydrogenase